MAKLYTGLYQDQAAADRVVYDLFKAGVQRHTIATASKAGIKVNEDALNKVLVEEEMQKHRAEIDKGHVLVVAWMFGRWVKDAEKIMNQHEPLLFEMQDAT